jgi:hypothetical protein
MVMLMIIVVLQLAACAQSTAPVDTDSSSPARVEPIAGTNLHRVILTAEAARRIDLQTAPLREARINGTARKVVPYSAVLYDLHGEAWVYTNPAPLTFVRGHITIDSINGDQVVLTDGPPAGTVIVTVGGPELLGSEFSGDIQET